MMLRYKLMFRSHSVSSSTCPSRFCSVPAYAASAIVASTSTSGSMLMLVICFTTSEGEWRSMTRLWILIWKRSQVLEPSPQGVLRVVIRRTLVGMRTGPFTFSCLSLAPRTSSEQTFSRDLTLLEVRVMRIRWMGAESSIMPPFMSPPLSYIAILLENLFILNLLGLQLRLSKYQHSDKVPAELITRK